MSRLGGKSIKSEWVEGAIDRLHVWTETLTDAPAALDARSKIMRVKGGSNRAEIIAAAKDALRSPDTAAIARATDRAETLIADAQALDPRLVKRASWVRGCEGETACPALLMAGEEAAFFARRRTDTAGAASGEPVIVTISTDSSEVDADSLAAFIATVKIVQQFRPVHVVWQGAWLHQGGYTGFVFHVPLITGDMDFERLAFAINSRMRDTVSFAFAIRRAHDVTKLHFNNASTPADHSYLIGSVDFIDHAGIRADAESIAARACKWLGWDAPWMASYRAESDASSALCRWEAGESSMRAPAEPYRYEEPTSAQRAQWRREADAREREAAARNKSRLDSVK